MCIGCGYSVLGKIHGVGEQVPGELIYSVKSPSLSADSRGGLMPSIGGAEPMHTP